MISIHRIVCIFFSLLLIGLTIIPAATATEFTVRPSGIRFYQHPGCN